MKLELPKAIYVRRIFMDQPGHLPFNAHWQETDLKGAAEIPAEFTSTLDKGHPIGGRVIDTNGDPIVGATTLPSVSRDHDVAERYCRDEFFAYDVVSRLAWHRAPPVTDAGGRWPTGGGPPDASRIHSRAVGRDQIGRRVPAWSVRGRRGSAVDGGREIRAVERGRRGGHDARRDARGRRAVHADETADYPYGDRLGK